MKRKGILITFEGIDGSGKSTQLRMTEKYLRDKKYKVMVLREPGSTSLAENIRKILLHNKNKINASSELFLYEAARAELVCDVILPALQKGIIVLCDRYYDSTTAYQGYGRGIDLKMIERLNNLAVGRAVPNLTFLVDIDYRTSLGRRKKVSDRLESESRRFFGRVRRGFLEIARNEKKRIMVLDGRKKEEAIFSEVVDCLRSRLKIK